MPIADIAASRPNGPIKGPPCSVCIQLATLPPSEAAALRTLLSDASWRYQELADKLQVEGIDLSSGTLSRHARGRCIARERLR